MDKETVVMLVTGSELMGAERIRETLFKAGFRVVAVDTSSLQEAPLSFQPDLIIANLSGNPDTDLEICELLGRLDRAPIIAIGPSGNDAFRVGMLERMVDDFITRPVNNLELVARVHSILRRRQPASFPMRLFNQI